MNVEWRDIVNPPGCYQISNHGEVKSLKRNVIRAGRQYPVRERILKPMLAKGCPHVVLCKNGVHRYVYISVLLREAGF
jgi:NUMOD4 motif